MVYSFRDEKGGSFNKSPLALFWSQMVLNIK